MSDPARYSNGDLGFVYYPSAYPNAPGASRLDIILHDNPTERHFDPEAVELTTRGEDGRIERQTFTHPWPWENDHWVCPGRVILVDRKSERVDAYTFGGSFTIHSQDHKTVASLESTAPIVDLHAGDDISRLLVAEVEILLAMNRAELLPDLSVYEIWLANLDPLEFYAACLLELQDKFDEFPEKDLTPLQNFLNFLDTEIVFLKRNQHWPANIAEFAFLD